MKHYALPADLSFCLVDERPIFLDISSDRYFRLSGALESSFLRWATRQKVTQDELNNLIHRGILRAGLPGCALPTQPATRTRRSILELPATREDLGIRAMLEVLAIVLLTQTRLKLMGFKSTITWALRPAKHSQIKHIEFDACIAASAAYLFLRARKLVPLDTCCLLDSLAMARFLGARGLRANIVIGVTGDPFTAHCWVQAADLVLNDAIGNVRMYSQIRVL
jgi:hypothetical protein